MNLPAHPPVVVRFDRAASRGARTFAAFVPTENVGDVIPDIPLVDQDGRRISLRANAHPTIVSFAYTRCPDPAMCPLVTAKFAALQRILVGTGIRLVEITLDPAFDRPAVLHRYAGAVGALPDRWSLATGRPNDVLALAERFGIAFDRARTPAGHTDLVAIVASDGTIADRIDGVRWSPGDVAAQARADAGLASSPIRLLALRLFASASAACGGRGGGFTLLAAIALFAALTIGFASLAVRLIIPTRLRRTRT